MSKNRKVFLIDDDEIHNFLCESVIRGQHFADTINSYLWAEDALENLTQLVSEAPEDFPEIIFLDINMPGMDGWEFIEEYQKLPSEVTKGCLLFVLSSAVDKNDILHARNLSEVNDFFSKPLTPDILNIISEHYPMP
ncbi:receiver component of a two-component response regulator [Rufibacter radiotolerans]|uniref:Receiver component of a two-component response regulator n=1 Tax=Rufibacter radiotolerans TaxID=1379910 RepID=A0A0H4VPU7_9BACT|nr:response regulator [Rufibacter radiotolerans]AKQ45957.1 receiver component of a two-component response regulator [Rufibacter radiotolerans]